MINVLVTHDDDNTCYTREHLLRVGFDVDIHAPIMEDNTESQRKRREPLQLYMAGIITIKIRDDWNWSSVREAILSKRPPDTSCFVCGKSMNIRWCTHFKSVTYCSKQCQKKHWKKHKKICQSLKNTNK